MTESQVTEIVRALWSIEHELKQFNKARKIKAVSKVLKKSHKRNEDFLHTRRGRSGTALAY